MGAMLLGLFGLKHVAFSRLVGLFEGLIKRRIEKVSVVL
jgi:hypothetical protein